MTPDDLRKIAEAATPGEWVRDGISVLGAREEHDLNTGPARLATMMMPWERERMEANAEFIATFNPQRVLELLDENQRLSQRVTRLSNLERRNAKQRDEARARLAAVEKLHSPVEIEPSDTICGHCSFQLPNGKYFGKIVEYPCDTIKAARGE